MKEITDKELETLINGLKKSAMKEKIMDERKDQNQKEAEQWIITNWRSRHNPLLDKYNKSLPQYSFDDVVEMMVGFYKDKITGEIRNNYGKIKQT